MPATPATTTFTSSGTDAQCPVPDASPSWHPRALHLLSLPNHSLVEVAEALSIPLHQLARFVLSQPGLEATTDIQAASIIHARTAAAASLPKVVSVLSQTLDDFLKTNANAHATPESDTLNPNTHDSAKPTTPTTPSTEARHLRALRAAHLLVRLANFQPKPVQRLFASTTPPPASPTPPPTNGPAPQSPRLQPGHRQPAPVEYAVTLPINEHAFADAPTSSAPPNLPTPPTHHPAPQSPRLQPGHNHNAPIEHAVTLPTCEHAITDAPLSSVPPTRASPAPLSPRLQPDHNQPTHPAPAPLPPPALDAPWASDRCEERSEPQRASPSNHQRPPLPPPGRTTHQSRPRIAITPELKPPHLSPRPTLHHSSPSHSTPPHPSPSCSPLVPSPPLPTPHSPLPSLHPP
ncbi:MAG TPA: hypothetical protein VHN77_14395 [Phycisphaerales bacterium]|nr:hypothetical protein [Phycisphaerales bacterium]